MSDSEQERRRHERYRFDQLEGMAPIYHQILPTPWCFLRVQCHDLSVNGISFFFDERPGFQECVIALSKPSEIAYFQAKIVNAIPCTIDGRKRYRVGCKLLSRLYLDEKKQRFLQPKR